MLEKVKKAMRITVSAYDDELGNLIASAVATLQSLGITWATEADSNEPMAERAIITYCRLHFGTPDDFDKMAAAWNSQVELLLLHRHSVEEGD